MQKTEFSIGHLSRQTGCKVTTIRYYEKIGLLPEPGRSDRNTRVYEQAHLDRLAFIRHCRELGFAQEAVRELLELTDHPDQSCEADMIATCRGGQIGECRIVETLADQSHAYCVTDDH